MEDFHRPYWYSAVLLSSLVMGCASPMTKTDSPATAMADSADDDRSVELVSASQTQAVTFLDDPSLQYGTGAIDPDPPQQFSMTPSGLRYRILRKSTGAKPMVLDTVTVNYRGWLDSGKEFDSSYDRGTPISFPLSGVIAGWTEGMQLIGEGGMIELWVPASLGYGSKGSGGNVPPNATLHFIVELIRVKS